MGAEEGVRLLILTKYRDLQGCKVLAVAVCSFKTSLFAVLVSVTFAKC